MKKRVCIGIPCYNGVPAETLEDYMLFAFYLGRHYQDYDFFVAIKSKSEQFRARNAIVEAAMSMDAHYLLMLDDDHVIDWEQAPSTEPNANKKPYEFLRTLLHHMDTAEKPGIVGALYYQRGGDCKPVVMKEGKNGGYYWMREDEIKNQLQEVDVTGGGCFLVDMNLLSRIQGPWFEPEFQLGTDIQICEKVRKEGWKVYCDTSIVLGHVMNSREVITPKNRLRIAAESSANLSGNQQGIDPAWANSTALTLYRQDAEDYLEMSLLQMEALADIYQQKYNRFKDYENPDDYYKNLGIEQLGRQVWFHHTPFMIEETNIILSAINHNHSFKGLDFGCGSAPIGFELALRGHQMDFVDLDGAPAYEFTKWRAKKRNINCGFEWSGDYDFILFLDSIEHLKDWKPVLQKAVDSLKPEGFIITNFFLNQDYDNLEHINMDKPAVQSFLTSNGLYPINQLVWLKRDLDFMTKPQQKEKIA